MLPLILLASLLLASPRSLADPPVTFEVVATFDYSGVSQTSPTGINDRGDVAGYFLNQAIDLFGFVRFADGHFSGPIIDPNDTQGLTFVSGINNQGTLCGSYIVGASYFSFLVSGSNFTDLTVVDSDTDVKGLNDAGNFCGNSYNPPSAFVSIGGTVSSVVVPGAVSTNMNDINNLNECVGTYQIADRGFGFRRAADGALTYPILAPGAEFTILRGVNDKGRMVGSVLKDYVYQAVYFPSPGAFAIYDYPGAVETDFTVINNRNLICGSYVMPSESGGLVTRGIIVRAKTATSD